MNTLLLSIGLTQINASDNGSFIAKCAHLIGPVLHTWDRRGFCPRPPPTQLNRHLFP